MKRNYPLQPVIRAPNCAENKSFSQQDYAEHRLGVSSSAEDRSHQKMTTLPAFAISHLLPISHFLDIWAPACLSWKIPQLCCFHGMTETVFKEAKSWLYGNCFLLYNSVILLNHPAVCISCFCSLQMPGGRHFITVKDQEFSFFFFSFFMQCLGI